MSQFVGTGTSFSIGAAKMAEVPERLLEDSTASSSSSENEEEIADTDGSLKTILDANTRPATACRTEEMDWSDNLSGIDNLIAASPSKTDGYSKEKGSSPMDELTESDTKKSVLTDIQTGRSQAIPSQGPDMQGGSETAPVTQTSQGRTGAVGSDTSTGPSLPYEGQDQDPTGLSTTVTQTSKGRTDSLSIEDKAKAYVKRKKEEQMAAIRSSLGDKALTYDAINAANRRKMAAP